MKTYEVPQELLDKILYLYEEKQYGREKIRKELNLEFGDVTLKKILKENGVHIRNFAEAKVGRKKQETDKELQDQIVHLYVDKGYGLDRIVQTLNAPFSFDKVRSILQDNNVHIRNCEEARKTKLEVDTRKYSINDDYNFESHNGAYILGFLASDGYIPKTKYARNRIVLTLQRRDEEILRMIANELEYTGSIYQFDATGGYPESSLSFTSKKIREKVESYGIVNNKTFKLHQLPDLPEEYVMDYIRGYFDGDGCVYMSKEGRIGLTFCGANKSFLEDISKKISSNCSIQEKKVTKHTKANGQVSYELRYGAKYDILKFGLKMYDNDYLALPRKKNHFFELRKYLPRA